MHIAAIGTGEPGTPPASYDIQASAATILPSLVAPILQRIVPPEVGPLARSTSARFIVSFTGWPVFCESSTDSGSRLTLVLPAQAPPLSAGTTRILPSGIPSTAALSERTTKLPWVEQ